MPDHIFLFSYIWISTFHIGDETCLSNNERERRKSKGNFGNLTRHTNCFVAISFPSHLVMPTGWGWIKVSWLPDTRTYIPVPTPITTGEYFFTLLPAPIREQESPFQRGNIHPKLKKINLHCSKGERDPLIVRDRQIERERYYNGYCSTPQINFFSSFLYFSTGKLLEKPIQA